MTPDILTSGATTPETSDGDITGYRANQMGEQLGRRVSDISAQEEEEECREGETGDDVEQRPDRRQGCEDRDEEMERLWMMEIDLDEDRTDEEKDEEEKGDSEMVNEEMKDRLYRLVTQSRLSYFSSTDEDLDKDGHGEGKWVEDKDEDVAEDSKEQQEEQNRCLTYRLCQLEKEVRATQFSSTEDELDRVAGDEEEGEDEELAAKVCRLANQVHASQFSSTEDELDTAERGEEEEEDTLWTLQANKAVQAVQLRDLASLVSASQFSSTEDELDRVEENDGGMQQKENEGLESSFEKGEVESRESFGEMDGQMFGLRDEMEEPKKENSDEEVTSDSVLGSQIIISIQQVNVDEDVSEQNDLFTERLIGETGDEQTALEKNKCEETDMAEKETDSEARQELKLKTVVEENKVEKKTEDKKEINEMRVEEKNHPEAKWSDERENLKDSMERKIKQEMAADSNEDEADFDRIISSMLMMTTLEDTQVEMIKDEAAGNGRISKELEDEETRENIEVGRETGFREKPIDAQSTNASDERESGGDVRPESEENVTELMDVSRINESRDATRNIDEQEEKKLTDKLEADEDKFTCNRQEVDEEDRKIGTEWQTMAMQGASVEGHSENKDLDEETKLNPDDLKQSSTSGPQEGLLSREEIQNVSTVLSSLNNNYN